ncbi:hypothetical protein [Paraburkholderia phytofirmans]|uniref:hypothetical protein n=1 Tax=Paraburkholderia phytofirmans TaxID=261302 RepID=UPI001427BB29|nr:hypothetical protein [Paraburkholderia phytofirmans]
MALDNTVTRRILSGLSIAVIESNGIVGIRRVRPFFSVRILMQIRKLSGSDNNWACKGCERFGKDWP